MRKSEIQKEINNALKEQQRRREWLRQVDRDISRTKEASGDGPKALLGALIAPKAILATSVAADKKQRKQAQKTSRKNTALSLCRGKFFFFSCWYTSYRTMVEAMRLPYHKSKKESNVK